MQIGEFAKLCHTKISVLRHYDKEGLLHPIYIDRFSGYRYYSSDQIIIFQRIHALKNAHFSLSEIKNILHDDLSNEEILMLFEKKKEELYEAIKKVDEAKNMLLGDELKMSVTFFENEKGMKASCLNHPHAKEEIEKALTYYNYQRISSYYITDNDLCCDVIKLSKEEMIITDDINLPFENDERIIGKWSVVGEFALKEEVQLQNITTNKNIYFLPNGAPYWSYAWTKDYILMNDDVHTTKNHYSFETIEGINYLFIDFKSEAYRHHGKTTVLVLKQLDHKAYDLDDLVIKEDTNLPFQSDSSILGEWKAVDFCPTIEAFDPHYLKTEPFYFSRIEFKENGEVIADYDFGKDRIEGKDLHAWTKGYWLRKWNHTKCAYTIRIINEVEYLFIEWKSGNYRWGHMKTDYYVFIRE